MSLRPAGSPAAGGRPRPGSSAHPPPTRPPAGACSHHRSRLLRSDARSERKEIGLVAAAGAHSQPHRASPSGAWWGVACHRPHPDVIAAVGHGGLELAPGGWCCAPIRRSRPSRRRAMAGAGPPGRGGPSASTARARSIRSLTMNRAGGRRAGARAAGLDQGAVGLACLRRYCTRPTPASRGAATVASRLPQRRIR